MKTIILYGELRKKFGREFQFDVDSPAEAVRALGSQVAGFKAYLHQHAQDAFKIFVGGRNVGDGLADPCSDKEVIRIVPVIQGAGAAGRIVLGIVLIVVSFFIPGSTPYAMQISSALFGMGASMVLGGVIELLSPVPKTNDDPMESAENTPSYNFNGPVNTTAQGHPVPLAYGRLRVGSAVISAGMTTQ